MIEADILCIGANAMAEFNADYNHVYLYLVLSQRFP
jgi:hypothetical protein